MSKVFVSYSNQDRTFVERLVNDLEAAGVKVFYDHSIKPGDSWAESLSSAIESADFLLVVLSPRSVHSKWVEQEIQIGLAREAERKASVIPLLLEPCEIPHMLAAKTYAAFDLDYQAGLNRILPILTGKAPRPTAPPPPRPAEIAQLKSAVEQFRAPTPASVPARDATSGRRRCFIAMPFGDEALQVVYEDFVKPVLIDKCSLEVERGDDVFGSNVVMDDIRTSIGAADLVVADLTRKNANVFYEVGICHTLDKPVLLLAQSMDEVPFDLRHRRVLVYDYSPRGCKKLEKSLEQHVTAMMSKL